MLYHKKEPTPPPSWIAVYRDAAIDEHLDATTPTRRALLVANALLEDVPSPSRDTFARRFAVALDRAPLHLYELERQVSPGAPVEQVSDHLAQRAERAMKGLS